MRFWLAAAFFLAALSPTIAKDLLEPKLTIARGGPDHPQVALTLDACSGGVDERILATLIDNKIPATIFVTRRWLDRNGATLKVLAAHPDLFEIEDHGADHVPAVLGDKLVYNIKPAGTLAAVTNEVQGGASAILAQLGITTTWYRGATALYSPNALALIKSEGFHIAGYSLNGDYGASVFASKAAKLISDAQDGDVIIAHINQPTRKAGAGVAQGILSLKSKGFAFKLLRDVESFEDDGD